MKNRYKIVHIAFKHRIDDTRIFRKQCVSLGKITNYDVTYITSDINSSLEMEGSVCSGVHRKIIKAYHKRIIRQFRYMKQIKTYIKKNADIDLIQLHESTLLLIALWIKRRGIKVIFDSHEDYYKQLKMRYRNSIVCKIIPTMYKAYEKYVCRRIDGVIFPCEMEEQQVFDYGVKRLVYLDNYPILQDKDIDIGQRKDFMACYAGTITYERGVVHDIKAWKKANIKGILAGNFTYESLKNQLEDTEEYKNVDFRGYCNAEELDAIYKEASVGMATLLNYGQYHKSRNFPTKVCEYMMYGMPVIIYRTAFVESIMTEYEFGIMVDPESVDEIANALIYLKDNPKVASNMGANGRKAVKEKFNWGMEEKKLFALYREILN